MSESRLIELSYFDPKSKVRLTAYADTIMVDRDNSTITAIRFGGYPEMVRAMSDAIYGGGTIEAVQNETKRDLKSAPKGYRRQLTHDGVYASATLMANDDALTAQIQGNEEDEAEAGVQQELQPRRCYIFCPAGDRDRLFEEVDRKTAAPMIPAFRDYVLDELTARGDLRQLEVFSLREKLDAFEGSVARGGGMGVMSSFNRLGVTWSGAHHGLMTGVLRDEWGMKGAAITDCSVMAAYMDYRLGVLAGQDLWDGYSMGMETLDGLDNDPAIVSAVQTAVKHIAYSITHSHAMNVGNATVRAITPWWQMAIYAATGVMAVLTAGSAFMLIRSKKKAKNG